VSEILETIRAAAARHGLNLVAALPVERYDAAVKSEVRAARIAPAARSIVVIGNGGGAFWNGYRKRIEADPAWEARQNPLDDFTREIIEHDLAAPLCERGVRCTTVYPFTSDAPSLNFIELGKLAGLGGPSIIGVLVHPTYGPWIAFRAAILLEEPLDAPDAALGFDPCPTCTVRTCISACPVGAVSFPNGWDVPACIKHRVENEVDCATRCHARVACVLGPEHRYPDDELAYHQARALRVMRPYYAGLMKSGRLT
jgi:epoxyqueuosine reductase